MKRILITAVALLLAIAAASCVKKETNGTYQISEPSPATKDAARRAGEQARESGVQLKEKAKEINDSEAMKQLKASAREAGRGLKKGAGVAIEEAGEKLQEVGREAQQDTPASTSTGTTTITTRTITTTTRRQ